MQQLREYQLHDFDAVEAARADLLAGAVPIFFALNLTGINSWR